VWGQSRAGQKVQRIFRNRLDELTDRDEVIEHGEFLWPPRDELDFTIRVNTADNRTIDEVPLEEIAKAITLILAEGGAIEEDDLILETTRMFGYQRRGDRIKTRIRDTLSLLEDEELITTGDRITLTAEQDPDTTLLARIYPSVTPSSTQSDDTDSDDDANTSQGPPESFPWLDYDRSQTQVPCPDCEAYVTNTKDAFISHWADAADCRGPGTAPPAKLSHLTSGEWETIAAAVDARTSTRSQTTHRDTTDTTPATGDQDAQDRSAGGDLSIQNPDGSFPWLHASETGWTVPCPYCDDRVFNSVDAFSYHWRESGDCPAVAGENPAPEIESVVAGDGTDTDRIAKLTTLFSNHLDRADPGEHWINCTFENDGDTDTHYQYLGGIHNLTRLTPSQRTALDRAVECYDLTIESEGDSYVSVTSGSQNPDTEAHLCLSLLEDVYNTPVEDLLWVAEHDDGYEAW
jgi:endogenous inhibitor of DNA gyrase (YacG/DUF329 family)